MMKKLVICIFGDDGIHENTSYVKKFVSILYPNCTKNLCLLI